MSELLFLHNKFNIARPRSTELHLSFGHHKYSGMDSRGFFHRYVRLSARRMKSKFSSRKFYFNNLAEFHQSTRNLLIHNNGMNFH
jgi:hypothetical protein